MNRRLISGSPLSWEWINDTAPAPSHPEPLQKTPTPTTRRRCEKRHSCINNPLVSFGGCWNINKKGSQVHHFAAAAAMAAGGEWGAVEGVCLSPIINHTIPSCSRTSRPGWSPRQRDSKTPSLQMALREHPLVPVWMCVCVCLFY